MPKPQGIYNEAFKVVDEETGKPMVNVPYTIESASGLKISGRTDQNGNTQRLFTPKPEQLQLYVHDEW